MKKFANLAALQLHSGSLPGFPATATAEENFTGVKCKMTMPVTHLPPLLFRLLRYLPFGALSKGESDLSLMEDEYPVHLGETRTTTTPTKPPR